MLKQKFNKKFPLITICKYDRAYEAYVIEPFLTEQVLECLGLSRMTCLQYV